MADLPSSPNLEARPWVGLRLAKPRPYNRGLTGVPRVHTAEMAATDARCHAGGRKMNCFSQKTHQGVENISEVAGIGQTNFGHLSVWLRPFKHQGTKAPGDERAIRCNLVSFLWEWAFVS